MAVTTLKQSSLAKMSTTERRDALAKLASAARGKPNGEVAQLEGRIAAYECRYGMNSETMRERFANGACPDTADVAQWLMLLAARDRVGK